MRVSGMPRGPHNSNPSPRASRNLTQRASGNLRSPQPELGDLGGRNPLKIADFFRFAGARPCLAGLETSPSARPARPANLHAGTKSGWTHVCIISPLNLTPVEPERGPTRLRLGGSSVYRSQIRAWYNLVTPPIKAIELDTADTRAHAAPAFANDEEPGRGGARRRCAGDFAASARGTSIGS